jgi:hypothetical protein
LTSGIQDILFRVHDGSPVPYSFEFDPICFFGVGHDRRKIVHFHVTLNPDVLWIVRQLRKAWAYKQPHRFLLFDRDAKFVADVVPAV